MIRRLLRPAIVLGLVAIVVRVESALAVAVTLGGWALAAWTLPRMALGHVEIVRRHPSRAMWGDDVEIGLEVRSRRRLRWLSITDLAPLDLGGSARWVVSMRRGDRRELRRTVSVRRRGLHPIGPTLLGTGDLYSFGVHERRCGDEGRLLVYPQIVPVADIAVTPESPEPVLATHRSLFVDPHRIKGVRDYRPGDPLRLVHWSSSASAGALVVKEAEPSIAEQVVVAVNLAHTGHPRSGRHRSGELAVIAAASLLHHLVTVERRPAGLRLASVDAVTSSPMDVDVRPEADDAHLMESLALLARARLDRTRTSDRLLDPHGLGHGTSLVLVTGRLDDDHLRDLVGLRRRGLSTRVVLTGATPPTDLRAVLDRERIGLAVIDRSSDLGVGQ